MIKRAVYVGIIAVAATLALSTACTEAGEITDAVANAELTHRRHLTELFHLKSMTGLGAP